MQLNIDGGSNNVSSSGIMLNGSTYYIFDNEHLTKSASWSIALQYTPFVDPGSGVPQILTQPALPSAPSDIKFSIGYFTGGRLNGLNAPGYYAGYYRYGSIFRAIGPFDLPTGTSSNLVLTDTGLNLTLYLNKTKLGSIRSSGIANTTDIHLGNSFDGGSDKLIGSIEYLKLYDYALLESEVQNL